MKQEEEDADFGQQLDRFARFDQAEYRRANEHADDQFAHHRRQSQRPQGDCDQPDAAQKDQQVESYFMHGCRLTMSGQGMYIERL